MLVFGSLAGALKDRASSRMGRENATRAAPTRMKQGEAADFAAIEPMKALPVTDLPVGDWLDELK